MTAFLIPTVPQAQQLQITLGPSDGSAAVAYNIVLRWNVPNQTWMMDIGDQDNNPILSGWAVSTGLDLLAAFEYLEIGGELNAGQIIAQTTSDTFATPTYTNLGTDGNLYWVTP